MQYIFIFLGGMLGAYLRYLISFFNIGFSLPIGTLIANIIGAFLMGLLTNWSLTLFKDYPDIKKGITTGLIGAFTTFSTFQIELVQLFNHDQFLLSFSYAMTSFILGILACYVGSQLGRDIST